jgi:hypothetical protein
MLRVVLTLLLMTVAGVANADSPIVIKAGRWEASFGDPNAKPMYTCRKADAVLDEKSVTSAMGPMAADCSKMDFNRTSDGMTYSLVCKVQEMTITSSGTTTFLGADSFTTVSHTHVEGGKIQVPDQNMSMHFRRLGSECQPSDRVTK